jgi:hypothetical protein
LGAARWNAGATGSAAARAGGSVVLNLTTRTLLATCGAFAAAAAAA